MSKTGHFRDHALNRSLAFDRDTAHQAPFLVAEIGARVQRAAIVPFRVSRFLSVQQRPGRRCALSLAEA
jgi:hypothetical protein